jgi:hypothetical protein
MLAVGDIDGQKGQGAEAEQACQEQFAQTPEADDAHVQQQKQRARCNEYDARYQAGLRRFHEFPPVLSD